MSSSKTSSDVVSTVPCLPIPALLTRMSNWLLPSPLGQFGVEGLEELANPRHGANVALEGKGFPACRFDLLDNGGCGLGIFLDSSRPPMPRPWPGEWRWPDQCLGWPR